MQSHSSLLNTTDVLQLESPIAAIEQLKRELQRQEEMLKRRVADVEQREAFIEECEARLGEKMQAQQERQIELDQKEEDIRSMMDRVNFARRATDAVPRLGFSRPLCSQFGRVRR